MNDINLFHIGIFLCLVLIFFALFIIGQMTERIAIALTESNRIRENEVDEKRISCADFGG